MKGLEFYSAAAQIIPLFLNLLGFQARAFAPGRLRKWSYWIALFAMTGEAAALITLYTEYTSRINALIVWFVLIMLGALCLRGDRPLAGRTPVDAAIPEKQRRHVNRDGDPQTLVPAHPGNTNRLGPWSLLKNARSRRGVATLRTS